MAKIKKSNSPAADFGPKERAQHATFRVEKTGSFGVRVRNIDSSLIDGMFYRGLIDADEHGAGSRFAKDCLLARMLGAPAMNFESTTRTQWSNIPNGVADAIDRINNAMNYVTRSCGAAAEPVVTGAIVWNQMPVSDGLPLLRRALSALCEFYYQPKKRYRFDLKPF